MIPNISFFQLLSFGLILPLAVQAGTIDGSFAQNPQVVRDDQAASPFLDSQKRDAAVLADSALEARLVSGNEEEGVKLARDAFELESRVPKKKGGSSSSNTTTGSASRVDYTYPLTYSLTLTALLGALNL